MRFKYLLYFFLGVCLLLPACSPGVYVNMYSSAPPLTPILIGMKRHEVEIHLGKPLYISRLDEDLYRGIYEYNVKIRPLDTLCFDIMDFTTLGLGNLLVSPVDRFKSSTHLIAVTYQMEDKYIKNDRVVNIKEKIKIRRVSS